MGFQGVYIAGNYCGDFGRFEGFDKVTHLVWSTGDKISAFVVILTLVFGSAWLALPSSAFIREVSTEVSGREVLFVRELRFGTVTAQWHSEITLTGENSFECQSGPWGVATYQTIPGNAVRYDLGEWADKCLDAGPPYYLTNTRRVLLFGVIPLRQSVSVTNVIKA